MLKSLIFEKPDNKNVKKIDSVKVWEEEVVIPTYRIGQPEKNPVFLEKRIYQGSSGAVYPHSVIEKIYDLKEDKLYKACYLENDYIKIMILPELGGRVQMAYDKVMARHFIYYNRVIKPALVGLTGPWISGGIEFNWPQHHRPSTFQPVDYCIEKFEDGSVTVWCSEIERMFQTKGMAGFTIYPGKAYLEIKVRLYNRTRFPQTFLWWANPAVKVNDEYQSVFPPDVNAVFDHGKREVSRFPIATGIYYKVDYSSGVDISRYKNIPVPTSYMAIHSRYDFVGGYEHDTGGGILHVADHHISPGKKQWTWGRGEFGKSWEKNLTDEDGPYIELMTGVYTDNQPDFSWLMPYEDRSFEQYFMPYNSIGIVRNATKNALVNLESENKKIIIKLYTTSEYHEAVVILTLKGTVIFNRIINISPFQPFIEELPFDEPFDFSKIEIRLEDTLGNLLVSWSPEEEFSDPIPEPAKPVKEPREIRQLEDLYLAGLHLEQYRHATFQPTDYYYEALSRYPEDIRCNNAVGLWLLKRGQFRKSEFYFRKAIQSMIRNNPNPYDGESYYNLGCCLKMQNKNDEAYDSFFKAVWNSAWQDPGYFSLAQIATINRKFDDAQAFIQKSLQKNIFNHKARHLKTALLRIKGQNILAENFADESLSIDKFNLGCIFEKYLIQKDSLRIQAQDTIGYLKTLMRGDLHTCMEIALDYLSAGLYNESAEFISVCLDKRFHTYPMIYYLSGYLDHLRSDDNNASINYKKASSCLPDYCFPNRIEEVQILNDALRFNPNDAKALYYLGNFWYANQQYDDAFDTWERSVNVDGNFPTALRNLSLIWFNKKKNPPKALYFLERAYALDKSDSRIVMELDQLYKRTGRTAINRLKFLDENKKSVEERDDLYLEKATLYNQLGKYEIAKELIVNHKFYPWEGGEGKVSLQYVICHLGLAAQAIVKGHYSVALDLLKTAEIFPENLGEGKLFGTQENNIHYFMGCAYEGLGDTLNSRIYFEKAAQGNHEPLPSFFYNDQKPEMIYYQGLALIKLKKIPAANSKFNKLIDYGEMKMNKKTKIDYFAVSLPDLLIWDDDLEIRNLVNCHYLIGLGLQGKGDVKAAIEKFNLVTSLDRNHLGALFQIECLKN